MLEGYLRGFGRHPVLPGDRCAAGDPLLEDSGSAPGTRGCWALLMLVPLANLISLWVLAFKEWPALRGRSGSDER